MDKFDKHLLVVIGLALQKLLDSDTDPYAAIRIELGRAINGVVDEQIMENTHAEALRDAHFA